MLLIAKRRDGRRGEDEDEETSTSILHVILVLALFEYSEPKDTPHLAGGVGSLVTRMIHMIPQETRVLRPEGGSSKHVSRVHRVFI